MAVAARLVAISPLDALKSPYLPSKRFVISSYGSPRFVSDYGDSLKRQGNADGGHMKALFNSNQQGSNQGLDTPSPVSMGLKPILDETQFDRVIAEAEQLEESVVILWMAKWCRKCIYLKPKLEKLAADYHPSVRFYCIDVNNIPYKLVVRGGVTKMPTIQLWKDSKKQGEVIGGQKAYLVVSEVREMIEGENGM